MVTCVSVASAGVVLDRPVTVQKGCHHLKHNKMNQRRTKEGYFTLYKNVNHKLIPYDGLMGLFFKLSNILVLEESSYFSITRGEFYN